MSLRLALCLSFLACAGCAMGQSADTDTLQAEARVAPTQWSATTDNPPCELQVYLGRVNSTRDASSCVRLCINAAALGRRAATVLEVYSREEGGTWAKGAVPWAAWTDLDRARGCAVFKNWSNNRFREARIVVGVGRIQ
jgi:hypothetical protein